MYLRVAPTQVVCLGSEMQLVRLRAGGTILTSVDPRVSIDVNAHPLPPTQVYLAKRQPAVGAGQSVERSLWYRYSQSLYKKGFILALPHRIREMKLSVR